MSKIKRKDLHLKEDAFLSLIDKSKLFIEEHQKWFIVGGSALILIIIIILAVTNFNRYRETRAQNMEETAYNLFFTDYLDIANDIKEHFPNEDSMIESPEEYSEMVEKKESKLKEALTSYQELYDRYPRTSSGERALYMTGYINFKLDNHEESYGLLRKYHNRYGDKGIFFIPAIKNLASLYEIKGERPKAIEFLKSFLSRTDFLYKYPGDTILLQTGLLLMNEGEYEEALAKFQTLEEKYPESMLISDAKQYSSLARFSLPVEDTYEEDKYLEIDTAIEPEVDDPLAEDAEEPEEISSEDEIETEVIHEELDADIEDIEGENTEN